jgi:hypothetical protein
MDKGKHQPEQGEKELLKLAAYYFHLPDRKDNGVVNTAYKKEGPHGDEQHNSNYVSKGSSSYSKEEEANNSYYPDKGVIVKEYPKKDIEVVTWQPGPNHNGSVVIDKASAGLYRRQKDSCCCCCCPQMDCTFCVVTDADGNCCGGGGDCGGGDCGCDDCCGDCSADCSSFCEFFLACLACCS